jgi:hypothetical protein
VTGGPKPASPITERSLAATTCPSCGRAPMVERVARRGKNAGERFLGCRAYPQCRGTRPIGEASQRPIEVAPPSPVTTPTRDVPGGSARARHDKLDAEHHEYVRSVRGRIIAVGIAGVILGVLWMSSGRTIYIFQPVFGLYLAIVSIIWTLGRLFVTPQHIRAWRVGAVGEEKTAAALERLGDSWVVLHDRRIPGSRANIDHIAIGPPGVFVIESKDYSGQVSLGGNEIRVNGRRVGWVDQVRREADAVLAVLPADFQKSPAPVTPIICVHRASIPWLRSSAGGVWVVSGGGLVKRFSDAPALLDDHRVREIAVELDRRLRRAT